MIYSMCVCVCVLLRKNKGIILPEYQIFLNQNQYVGNKAIQKEMPLVSFYSYIK